MWKFKHQASEEDSEADEARFYEFCEAEIKKSLGLMFDTGAKRGLSWRQALRVIKNVVTSVAGAVVWYNHEQE